MMDTDTSEAAFPRPVPRTHRGMEIIAAADGHMQGQLSSSPSLRDDAPSHGKRKEQKEIHACVLFTCLCVKRYDCFGPWGGGGSRCRTDLTGEHSENATQPPLVGPTLCIIDGLNCWHSSTDTYSTRKRNSTNLIAGLMPSPYIFLELI